MTNAEPPTRAPAAATRAGRRWGRARPRAPAGRGCARRRGPARPPPRWRGRRPRRPASAANRSPSCRACSAVREPSMAMGWFDGVWTAAGDERGEPAEQLQGRGRGPAPPAVLTGPATRCSSTAADPKQPQTPRRSKRTRTIATTSLHHAGRRVDGSSWQPSCHQARARRICLNGLVEYGVQHSATVARPTERVHHNNIHIVIRSVSVHAF